ncbi:helix-turn-helix transcriptional regulator [Sphingobium psychrophilum]|nr:hypothetical protein [Sphingobium psychrophilum]
MHLTDLILQKKYVVVLSYLRADQEGTWFVCLNVAKNAGFPMAETLQGAAGRRASESVTVDFSTQMITVVDFARLARLSRRQIDRLRQRRPGNFPREFELGTGHTKYRRCPRFRLSEVQAWLDSRALW